MITFKRQLNIIPFLIIAVICFLTFLHSLKEPLYGETYLSIWYELKDTFSIGQFLGEYYGHDWKPLERVAYYIEYHLFGLDALGYRIVNLVFHFAISCLVFYLSNILTRHRIVSLLSTLIFITHFAHWEITLNTNIMHYLLSGISSLICMIYFLKFLDLNKNTHIITAYCAFLFSLLSSQTSVTLPLILFFSELFLSGVNFREVWRRKFLLKYLPFILMAGFYVVGSILLQLGVNSPHDPFSEDSYYTIYAPIWRNLRVFLIQLFVPFARSDLPLWQQDVLFGVIATGLLFLILKGTRLIRFSIVWMLASISVYLFWTWNPVSKYTYLPTIPFSILAGAVILETYRQASKFGNAKKAYVTIAGFVIIAYLSINCISLYISPRVKGFNISGRNSITLLREFQNIYPKLPDEGNIYITGLPEGNFFEYGCWTYAAALEKFLWLFYRNTLTVEFVDEETIQRLAEEAINSEKKIFAKFANGKFLDL